MLDYYKILKDSRKLGFEPNYNYRNPDIRINQQNTRIETEGDFVRSFILSIVRDYFYENLTITYIPPKMNVGTHLYSINNIEFIKLEIESTDGRPKNIFDPFRGTLGIAIMEVLKEQYKVEDLTTLINVIDPKTPLNNIIDITTELLSNNHYYGFFGPISMWINPLKLKKDIKIHEFKLEDINIDKIIKRSLCTDGRVEILVDESDPYLYLQSITNKKVRIPITDLRLPWIISLNKEHLIESLDNLYLRYTIVVKNSRNIKEKEIEKLESEIRLLENNVEQVFDHLNNFQEYKKTLWRNY